jgi:hydroxypyruvate reductase/glycerate 2-kinase
MTKTSGAAGSLRDQARAIWNAAVAAARPEDLIHTAFENASLKQAIFSARRILVVGAGKAGAAMSAGIEQVLADRLDHIEGLVNVPAQAVRPLRKICLHAARSTNSNEPTAEGVPGARRILDLVAHAGPDDVALCLLSGGGSALLPAPVDGITLEEKQRLTRLLHACGATINEMNAVRKHLSAVKGGRLAAAFTGRALHSLIISDVIGDPLDVIASGPTAADPTTFADALAVLAKYRLQTEIPERVRLYLERGSAGLEPETLTSLAPHVHNHVIANNGLALAAAQRQAEQLGWPVLNLGSYIQGETSEVARVMAGIVRSIRADGRPMSPPVCLLFGGETTVTLGATHGLGGRNQEFVLAMLVLLEKCGLGHTAALSGGTDGEDGPTDAAGAVVDAETFARAKQLALVPDAFLRRHDAYSFFDATGDLLRTGLTHTNVMDVRVILLNRD